MKARQSDDSVAERPRKIAKLHSYTPAYVVLTPIQLSPWQADADVHPAPHLPAEAAARGVWAHVLERSPLYAQALPHPLRAATARPRERLARTTYAQGWKVAGRWGRRTWARTRARTWMRQGTTVGGAVGEKGGERGRVRANGTERTGRQICVCAQAACTRRKQDASICSCLRA
jgi:hypothetical protein